MAKPTPKPAAAPPTEPATTPADPPAKGRSARLSRMEFARQLTNQGGKCYVLGVPLDGAVIECGGVLISEKANKLRGGRPLADLRDKLKSDLLDAEELVKLAGGLRQKNGAIVFAGEKAADAAGVLAALEAAKPASEPASESVPIAAAGDE